VIDDEQLDGDDSDQLARKLAVALQAAALGVWEWDALPSLHGGGKGFEEGTRLKPCRGHVLKLRVDRGHGRDPVAQGPQVTRGVRRVLHVEIDQAGSDLEVVFHPVVDFQQQQPLVLERPLQIRRGPVHRGFELAPGGRGGRQPQDRRQQIGEAGRRPQRNDGRPDHDHQFRPGVRTLVDSRVQRVDHMAEAASGDEDHEADPQPAIGKLLAPAREDHRHNGGNPEIGGGRRRVGGDRDLAPVRRHLSRGADIVDEAQPFDHRLPPGCRSHALGDPRQRTERLRGILMRNMGKSVRRERGKERLTICDVA
jgi:hypothetical protein